jgi:hypothetical protein
MKFVTAKLKTNPFTLNRMLFEPTNAILALIKRE